jgi:hypothetical protein
MKMIVDGRKVWRTTAPTPLEVPQTASARTPSSSSIRRPRPHWQTSAYDLRNGLEVMDFANTLPADIYGDLF